MTSPRTERDTSHGLCVCNYVITINHKEPESVVIKSTFTRETFGVALSSDTTRKTLQTLIAPAVELECWVSSDLFRSLRQVLEKRDTPPAFRIPKGTENTLPSHVYFVAESKPSRTRAQSPQICVHRADNGTSRVRHVLNAIGLLHYSR